MANVSLPELGVSTTTDRDRSWIDGTQACEQTDPSAFNPGDADDDDVTAASAAAAAICQLCPLIRPCLRYALEGPEWGVWGGRGDGWRKRARKRIAAGESTLEGVLADEFDRDTAAAA